ncbi:MAG: hypothetical protein KAH32_00795 [Chlamydiia bacterium]|nr:hypothetical protein [Chlamydiia bacterium]
MRDISTQMLEKIYSYDIRDHIWLPGSLIYIKTFDDILSMHSLLDNSEIFSYTLKNNNATVSNYKAFLNKSQNEVTISITRDMLCETIKFIVYKLDTCIIHSNSKLLASIKLYDTIQPTSPCLKSFSCSGKIAKHIHSQAISYDTKFFINNLMYLTYKLPIYKFDGSRKENINDITDIASCWRNNISGLVCPTPYPYIGNKQCNYSILECLESIINTGKYITSSIIEFSENHIYIKNTKALKELKNYKTKFLHHNSIVSISVKNYEIIKVHVQVNDLKGFSISTDYKSCRTSSNTLRGVISANNIKLDPSPTSITLDRFTK